MNLDGLGKMTSKQKQLLPKSEDASQRALQKLLIEEQHRQLVATTISNILKTRAEGQQNGGAAGV
jgi:hypothetical protein